MSKPAYAKYFNIVESGSKNPELCCVKFCRKHKVEGRKICYKHHLLSWRMSHPIRAAYSTLRDHAVRRKVKFTITFDDYKKLVLPTRYIEDKGNTKHDLHIDRIDPLRGYEVGNLQILTCSENSVKGATKDKAQYVNARIDKYLADHPPEPPNSLFDFDDPINNPDPF